MKFFSTILFFFLVNSNQVFSQALYPISTSEKVINSSLIFEGKVVNQRSFWNPGHTMIFTANTVEVYKTFKGVLLSGTVEVMTTGGNVGLESIDASDLLTLEKDNIGVFFCYPNSIKLLSPFTGDQLFDVYSSSQGCYTYDLRKKTANAPFVRYASIENQLYKELVQLTGNQPTIVNGSFNLSVEPKPQTPLAPAITSFSPQTVNAGATLDPANNLLTINGSGFGNVPGATSAVIFDDANDGSGGTPFVVAYNSSLVQSWTDNQIKIRVPSRAGTGNLEVRDDLSVSSVAPGILNINYAVLTQQATESSVTYIKQSNLMNDNGSGGYTVLYSTGTGGGGVNLDAAPEKATFQRALNTWKEVAGLNVIEGGTSTNQAIASDGENLILFDNTSTGQAPLSAGVLAVCYSYSGFCSSLVTNAIQKAEFDIVIRNTGVSVGSTVFTSGPCAPQSPYNEIDLETVLFHELGHALNLGHVNDAWEGSTYPNFNAGKVMNYSIKNGISRKSPDYSAYSGALYCITPKGNIYGTCSGTLTGLEMTPLGKIVVSQDECPIVFPSVATAASTVINFDLVHTTSNKYTDPAYNGLDCSGALGTNVTNNAYYAIKSGSSGGNMIITVSAYGTTPAAVSGCPGAGVKFALFQVNSCPLGQAFPTPVFCRNITRNGAFTVTGLAPNTSYLIYVDGIDNTKANFTLTLDGAALPVTLVNFNGSIVNNMVNLFWKTSSEINSREFLVEKSFDGTTFNAFKSVAAKGNSNSETSYLEVDPNPYSDITFYRLKIVDKDGNFKYSGIIKVKTPRRAIVIERIFPNPTTGKLNFQVVADSRKLLTIEVFDLLGKKINNLNLTVERGINQKPVFVNALASGTYFIQVKDAEGNVVEKSKFIKN